MDDALGLTETATACLQESRGGRNVQHELAALLRQSVYSRLAGYEDTNDAERLAQDPAMRVIVGRRGLERQAASTNTMSRFETEVLTRKHNPEGLARMNAQWVDRAMPIHLTGGSSWTWIAQRTRYMGNRREQPTMATLAARAPGGTGSVHPSLQPGELAAQAMPAQGGQALVVAKPAGQTYQDSGEASSPRPAAGVSASRGSSASGGIPTSAGAYRRAPSSTGVASILGIIGGDEDSQGGAVRLDELKGVQTC